MKNKYLTFSQSNLALMMQQQQYHRKITLFFASVLTLWPNGKHVSWNSWTTFVGAFTPAINSVNETICKNTKQNRNEISAQIIILSKFGEYFNATHKFDLTNSTFGKFVLTNFAQN